MTLLEDIQNSLANSTNDLGTILRKCKIFAARLDNKLLEDWLLFESNGYPESVSIPEYRIWPLEVRGDFSGPFGSGGRNMPIPLACIPKKTRGSYQRYEYRQSIASVEAILAKADGGIVRISAGDLALILGQKVYQNQNCINAWAEVGTNHLVELLNSVRNRILDFSLAIWKEYPTAGETATKTSNTVDASRVTQIFNTTIYGGSANLIGTANRSMIEFNTAGDFSSLELVLHKNGVETDDIKALKAALESEKLLTPNSKGFGPKVSSWIATMLKKAAEGSWDIGKEIAATLLAQVISKFYGL